MASFRPPPSPASVTPDILEERNILFLSSCEGKREALEQMIALLAHHPAVEDAEALQKGIFYRESLMSTGIGLGIGVPHVRLPSIRRLLMAVGICQPPLKDYASIDNVPVSLIFMIVAGEKQHGEYLTLLASICTRCKEERFRQALSQASTPAEVHRLLVG